MKTTKYQTIFDRILAKENLYQINGVVFSNTTPKVCLGNFSKVLPKLLEKNKSQTAKSEGTD